MIKDIFNPQEHIYEDDSWIFADLGRTMKIDVGLFLQIPGWETEQTIMGNGIAHFRNLTGNVDNVEIDWKRLVVLVNDNNPKLNEFNSITEWGVTLGPYINGQNMEIEDDMYKHRFSQQ